ncbi:MAG: fumarylacetoacetate hydrolase family protein [Odoribacteraceae bacterium]|nr:fumarylacetoacetate hydrolase family protein [Odoribacteraceae bacterium]
MKLLCVEHGATDWGFAVLGDNALSRNNDDFYVPPFAGRLSCVPQLVFRIGRMGKGVEARFASRYAGEIGVGIRFYADDLLEDALAAGLPTSPATGFDHAAAVSVTRPLAGGFPVSARYAFEVNGVEVFRGSAADLFPPVDRALSRVSAFCLLKVGDLLFCGNRFRYDGLRVGDHLRVSLDDAVLLDFSVR